jgi:hypothetical protein
MVSPPSLPPSLRIKIWRFAALSPRHLEIFMDLGTRRFRRWSVPLAQFTGDCDIWTLDHCQPPALLSTSRESRREVHILQRFGTPTLHYFNPEFDVICVTEGYLFLDRVLKHFDKELGGIRRLATRVMERSWCESGGSHLSRGLWDIIPNLKGLTEIQVNLAKRRGQRSVAEVVRFKVATDSERNGASVIPRVYEMEFEKKRLWLRECGMNWKRPEVRYGSFECGEVIPNVKQMLKDEGGTN